ncbi:hypothetical protein JRG66_02820 [Salinimicrobium tongyeongense]|uniref:Response receiver domain-containing protein n=1 Tax=Salinimicrobium tongyeongense TaxID=2809707 RepID=A0ABY6NTF0_9FLAO|nr:hypothetical protein [Salinimicrobium tongyeongense]UZH55833.1 hypothetical protein JRG66_02820 [Salinimicrobium tongyeongense]
MTGVVLYADDHIFVADRAESALYEELRKDTPVLGIERIDFIEQSTKAIGSFRAIILDWQFSSDDEFEDVGEELGIKSPISQGSIKENETFTFLINNDFYSLIYIFSQKDVEGSETGRKLKERFGNRIRFKIKDEDFSRQNISNVKTAILADITEWEEKNRNLSAPIRWSEAINLSIQKVFKELSEATDNWLKHIYASADADGVDPELFVIELMQLLLSENLVQDENLIEAICVEGKSPEDLDSLKDLGSYQKSISKLFSILTYSKLKEAAPIMTGDICVLDEHSLGIIVTPECDIKYVQSNEAYEFELLTFRKDSFPPILLKNSSYKKGQDDFDSFKDNRKDGIRKLFNQEIPRLHFLSSLPLNEDFNLTVVLDFRLASKRVKSSEVKKMERPLKINSPFIQQIRQRYIAYIGRVGVPALSNHSRDWNLR